MTKLLTGLAVGTAMLLGVSAAQAEPMKLTGQQLDNVTAGGFTFNLALADAHALAFGRVSIASTKTSTFSAPGVAAASSSSASCSGFFC